MEQNNEGIDLSKEEALISGAPAEVKDFNDTLSKIDEGIKKGRREMGLPVDDDEDRFAE